MHINPDSDLPNVHAQYCISAPLHEKIETHVVERRPRSRNSYEVPDWDTVLGQSSTSRNCSISSLEGEVIPGRHWMTSSGRSDHLGCGMPITAAIATEGCPLAAFSTWKTAKSSTRVKSVCTRPNVITNLSTFHCGCDYSSVTFVKLPPNFSGE